MDIAKFVTIILFPRALNESQFSKFHKMNDEHYLLESKVFQNQYCTQKIFALPNQQKFAAVTHCLQRTRPISREDKNFQNAKTLPHFA